MPKTVLVGDSNYAEFEVLHDLLTAKGFKVIWLKNGRDVMSQFGHIKPDLMILDALLPGMTGLKITQAIKAIDGFKDVKVILMSSVYKQFRQQYESRKKVGVDAYTEKPVNVAELENLIDDLIGPAVLSGDAVSETTITETGIPVEKPAEKLKKVGLSGDLADIPFPKLAFLLYKYRRTGALRISRDQVSKVIYFRSGAPVFVTSNQSRESLGRFLVLDGTITQAQYNASLEEMLATGNQHGDILLKMGAVTPHELFAALEKHIRDKVLSIFSWEKGKYSFQAGQFDLDQNVTLRIDPVRLAFEGISRYYPLRRLEAFFNEYKNQRLVKRKNPAVSLSSLGFGPAEMRFITLINNRRTVGRLVAQSNLTLTKTFQVLFLLILLEVIRFKVDRSFGTRGDEAQRNYVKKNIQKREELRRVAESGGSNLLRLNQYMRTVNKSYARFKGLNHYERLELTSSATVSQVKQAYYLLSLRYHDHRHYQHADEAIQKRADKLFQAITQAYSTLIDPHRRKRYDIQIGIITIEAGKIPPDAVVDEIPAKILPEDEATLHEGPVSPQETVGEDEFEFEFDEELLDLAREAGESSLETDQAAINGAETQETDDDAQADEELDSLWGGEEIFASSAAEDENLTVIADEQVRLDESRVITSDMASVLKAEMAFQNGEEALEQKDWDEAISCFKTAIKLAPKEAEYYEYLGWTFFLKSPDEEKSISEAKANIELGINMNPSLEQGHYFMGVISERLGNIEQARTYYEKALQNNPGHVEAAESLKSLSAD
jgi:DNA-binding response OmpR family regulator/curved DNA-binding protein CbpA